MKAIAETNGKRIYVKTTPEGAAYAKRVPGASWRKSCKDWSYPLTLRTCYALRKEFGRELRVGERLAEWARGQINHENILEAIRSGEFLPKFPRLKKLAANLHRAIHKRSYQAIGAAFCLEAEQSLLGDVPGLGKTLQALAVVTERGSRRILVTCPKTATSTVWESEVRRWTPHIRVFVAPEGRADRERAIERFLLHSRGEGSEQFMLVINTEMIRVVPEICPDGPLSKCEKEIGEHNPRRAAQLFEGDHEHHLMVAEYPELTSIGWDAIIMDESHHALASTANSSSKNITQSRLGAVRLRKCLKPGGIALALSGTPFRSRLTKSWGTLNWLDPRSFSSYWDFAERHFEVTDGRYGKIIDSGAKIPVPRDMELFQNELRPRYLSRTKEAVAPDLPPIFYPGVPPENRPDGKPSIWIEMSPKQARAYREMVKMARAQLEAGEITAVGVLAELTRLRQFACSYGALTAVEEMIPALPSNKIDWILEFLLEKEGNENKVVLASSFTKLINLGAAAIQREFRSKDYVSVLTGETGPRQRKEMVRRFQDPSDDMRVMFLNSRAGGESITLDMADDLVFTDLPWTSDETEQVENRVHRVSRIHRVSVYRLGSRGTIDEKIAALNDDQLTVLRSARPQALSLYAELLEDA